MLFINITGGSIPHKDRRSNGNSCENWIAVLKYPYMRQGEIEMEVCLKRGEELDIAAGSLWIYDNEVNWYTEDCYNGCVVDVLDSRRRFVARGFFNGASKIVVRVLTRDRNEGIDREFFRRRITAAWEYRKSILTVEDMTAAAEQFSQYYTQEMVETMTDEEYVAYDAAWAELVLTVAEANLSDIGYLSARTTQVRVELEDGYWMLTDESLQELDLLMIQY